MLELKQIGVIFTSIKISSIIINYVKSISFKIHQSKYTLNGYCVEDRLNQSKSL